MKIDSKKGIFAIALFYIIYGLFLLFKNFKVTFFVLPLIFSRYFLIAILTLVSYILFAVTRFLGGLLLLKMRIWGKRLVISIAILDFILGFNMAIRMIYYTLYPVPIPKVGQNATMIKVSCWPSYILAFISLLIIYVLSHNDMKEQLK